MRVTLAALTTSCAVSIAAAQVPSPSPAPAASPSPAAAPAAAPAASPSPATELQKLAFLVGDWIHEEKYAEPPLGPGGPGKARSKATWVLGNHHLYMIYAAKTATAQMEGRGFLGWDANARAYRMAWFDNRGHAAQYTGNFDATGALVLTGEVVMGGRPTREQFTVKPQPDGKVVFTSAVAGADGAMQTMLESTATAEKK